MFKSLSKSSLALWAVTLLLLGCGQKGPLTLHRADTASPTPAAAAASAPEQ